eukprot:TRINITY_DN23094_c0_g1_i1.p1 TRINITY_DN23094_c0_g1~~TRINITY_DN23094_c0_g1_i1.p1  ORF type:complete len:251 (+),score=57.25 TRINITY_DN23094_c0_g1_i1:185-937(+)
MVVASPMAGNNPAVDVVLDQLAVPPFLEAYGLPCKNAEEWSQARDELSAELLHICVSGHMEVSGHTHYHVDCQLSRQSKGALPLRWRVSKRLAWMRCELHDAVKARFATTDRYKSCFQDTPFARHGGVRGTTSRLDAWCRRLAHVINTRQVSPSLAAHTLHVLSAPNPDAGIVTGASPGPGSFGVGDVPDQTDMSLDYTFFTPAKDKDAPSGAKDGSCRNADPETYRMDTDSEGGQQEEGEEEEGGFVSD